jgi:SAM-dependent methyltransferase
MTLRLNEKDALSLTKLYSDRYKDHGYDPKTLGWFKGKQELRFSILTSQVDLEGQSILDIGCGFGDLNYFLKRRLRSYVYHGIDLVDELVDEGRRRHPEAWVKFSCGDFLAEAPRMFDYIVGSGIFNYRLSEEDNYDYIERTLRKAMDECGTGVAFDFLSDRVDFQKYGFTFHSNPPKVLEIAYRLSKNVILRNDYAPFEFSLFIFKDDSFDAENTVFNRFQNVNSFHTIEELNKKNTICDSVLGSVPKTRPE